MSWRRRFDIFTTVALGAMALVVIWTNVSARIGPRRAGDTKLSSKLAGKVVPIGTNVLGGRHAAVGVLIFSDFECPYCGTVAKNTMPALIERYANSGRVLFAFKHFPNETIHRHALFASQAAECAAKQGKFWQMHDLLFSSPSKLDRGTIEQYASLLNLSADPFKACVDGDPAAAIDTDSATAIDLGVSSTPNVLVGSVKNGNVTVAEAIAGAQPLSAFVHSIDLALASAVKDNHNR